MRPRSAFAIAIVNAAIALAQPPPTRSSVDELARAIAAQASAALANQPGAAVAVATSAELGAPAGPALADAVATALIAALREDPRWNACARVVTNGSGDAAAAAAAQSGSEVYVEARLRPAGNFLQIDGGVWRAGTLLRTISVRVRLDAELRRYTGPLAQVAAETIVARTAVLPSRGYVAMVGTDLDGDGQTELVLATRTGIEIVRLAPSRVGLRLARIAQAGYPPELAVAPTPRRRPIGSAVRADGAAIVRVSDRATSARVELRGGVLAIRPADGPCAGDLYPMDRVCAHLADGRDFFEPAVVDLGAGSHETAGSFYMRAAARMRTPLGTTIAYEAIVTPHGRLSVRIDERTTGAAGYGAALALSDLDDDGSAELILSSAQPIGGGDQLTMVRALDRGALHLVWRSEPLTGSVLVAGAGDLDADGLDELWAIEEPIDGAQPARLWVVR